jgi:2-hydroxy-3-keto-5-methylthiopentenyl-1-phosphate phosphatase
MDAPVLHLIDYLSFLPFAENQDVFAENAADSDRMDMPRETGYKYPMSGMWAVIVDFDGTITKIDADIYIAKRLLSLHEFNELSLLFQEYEATRITLAEYLERYLALVDTQCDAFRQALQDTPIRRDMRDLVFELHHQNNAITVASEGLDVYISPLMKALKLEHVPVWCNRVVYDNHVPNILPAEGATPCDRCISCKGSLVRNLKRRAPGLKVALIGNGASDFCAAKIADTVFARDSLARLCAESNIDYLPWSDATDITTTSIFKKVVNGGS